MLAWIASIDWVVVGQIILIDILLGGDNAIVIALACRQLPAKRRLQGIMWGTVGAILLRVALITFALQLLMIPALKIVGAVLLMWIGVKLLSQHNNEHVDINGGTSLWSAIKTIIIADFVMSLDNVIGIAGAAQHAHTDHQTALVAFGLLFSVPIIIWGSTIVLKLMDRFPIVITLGAALLGWIAGGLWVADNLVRAYWGESADTVKMTSEIVCAALVVLLGRWLANRAQTQSPPGT